MIEPILEKEIILKKMMMRLDKLKKVSSIMDQALEKLTVNLLSTKPPPLSLKHSPIKQKQDSKETKKNPNLP